MFLQVKHLVSLKTLVCKTQSRLQYLAVEYTKEATTVLYIGDGGTRSIFVWNVQEKSGYRVKLPHRVVQACSENPLDDVFYTVLVEQQTANYIYFTYLSSMDIFRTKTTDLQNRMNPKCVVNIGKKGI